MSALFLSFEAAAPRPPPFVPSGFLFSQVFIQDKIQIKHLFRSISLSPPVSPSFPFYLTCHPPRPSPSVTPLSLPYFLSLSLFSFSLRLRNSLPFSLYFLYHSAFLCMSLSLLFVLYLSVPLLVSLSMFLFVSVCLSLSPFSSIRHLQNKKSRKLPVSFPCLPPAASRPFIPTNQSHNDPSSAFEAMPQRGSIPSLSSIMGRFFMPWSWEIFSVIPSDRHYVKYWVDRCYARVQHVPRCNKTM